MDFFALRLKYVVYFKSNKSVGNLGYSLRLIDFYSRVRRYTSQLPQILLQVARA